MPSDGQVAVLLIAIVLLAMGQGMSLARLWGDQPVLRRGSRMLLGSGVLLSAAVLLWHALRRWNAFGDWFPLEDNFEALLWLAVLLGGFVFYVQFRRLGGLEWFIMPVIVLLLLGAVIFGKTRPQEYLPAAYSVVHRLTSFAGAVAFAISAASGAMYLTATRRLREKVPMAGSGLASLERLERLTFTWVTLGFALLTLGLASGFIWLSNLHGASRMGPHWFSSPKVLLAMAVWVVYAIILHAPINPRIRGRKTAILSIGGFVLMVGTLLAVFLMPAEMS